MDCLRIRLSHKTCNWHEHIRVFDFIRTRLNFKINYITPEKYNKHTEVHLNKLTVFAGVRTLHPSIFSPMLYYKTKSAYHATGNVDLAYIWMATNYIGT